MICMRPKTLPATANDELIRIFFSNVHARVVVRILSYLIQSRVLVIVVAHKSESQTATVSTLLITQTTSVRVYVHVPITL